MKTMKSSNLFLIIEFYRDKISINQLKIGLKYFLNLKIIAINFLSIKSFLSVGSGLIVNLVDNNKSISLITNKNCSII